MIFIYYNPDIPITIFYNAFAKKRNYRVVCEKKTSAYSIDGLIKKLKNNPSLYKDFIEKSDFTGDSTFTEYRKKFESEYKKMNV